MIGFPILTTKKPQQQELVLPEGTSTEAPLPLPAIIALSIATMLQGENRDELTGLFIKRLNRAVRQLTKETAPETLRPA